MRRVGSAGQWVPFGIGLGDRKVARLLGVVVPVLRLLAALSGALTLLGLVAPNVEAQTAHYVGQPVVVQASGTGNTFGSPFALFVDSAEQYAYVADQSNQRVVKVAINGGAETIVNQFNASTNNNCSDPTGVVADSSGNVYFTCGVNTGIYKATLSGSTYTVANWYTGVAAGRAPRGMAIDSSNNIYILVQYNTTGQQAYILKCSTAGSCSTFYSFPANGGSASTTYQPASIAVDSSGNLYIGDISQLVVYKLSGSTLTNIQSCPVVAGPSNPGGCYGVSVDANGVVYAGSNGPLIYKLTPNGSGYTSSTVYTAPGMLHRAVGIAVNPSGTTLYAADYLDASQNLGYGVTGPGPATTNLIKFAPSGQGFGSVAVGSPAGNAITVTFKADTAGTVGSVAVLTQGSTGLDFADAGTGTCTAGSTLSTTCTVNVTFTPTQVGLRTGAVVLKNSSGTPFATAFVYGTGTGPLVNYPSAVAKTLDTGMGTAEGIVGDAAGNLYIAGSGALYKETCTGSPCTYSRSTLATSAAGTNFNSLQGLAMDGAGNLYLGDGGNGRIVKEVLSGGTFTPTVICNSGCGANEVAVDAAGNVYFLSGATNAVEKLTMVQDTNGISYSGPVNIQSNSNNPWGVAVDSLGNVFYTTAAGSSGQSLYKLTPAGGQYSQTQLDSTLGDPVNIALDMQGNIYVAQDISTTSSVVKETFSSNTTYNKSTVASSLNSVIGVWVDASGNLFITTNPGTGTLLEIPYGTPPSLTFGSTNEGATTTTTTSGTNPVTLQNVGTAPFTLQVPLTGTNPSVAANFSASGSTNCNLLSMNSSTESLSAGSTCNLTVTFAPTVGGSISGSLVLLDNSLNAASPNYTTQTIPLSGTGVWLTPTVTSISPSVGPIAGGTTVTITGTYLNGATGVSFGGTAATIGTDTQTLMTVTSPAVSNGGQVDVRVTTPGGTSATSAADKFTYRSSPTVTLAVTSGGSTVTSVAPGSQVKLTATIANGGTAVTVGTVNFCDAAASYCTDVHLLGTAQLTSAGMAAISFTPGTGSHSYKAVFAGNTTNLSVTSSASSLTVTAGPSSTAITQSGSAGNYTLTATVTSSSFTASGGPTGNVSFLDTSNSNVSLGTATLGTPGTRTTSFSLAPSPTTGSSPVGVAVGDFNSDGKLDFVTANSGGNTVSVFVGTGNGTATLKSTISVGTSPNGVAVGDINGDGKPDIVVANISGSTVSVLLGNGDGTFTAGTTLNVGTDPEYPVLVDLNGDGNLDMVVANYGSATMSVFLGNGDGTFTLKGTPSAGSGPIGIAAGDINGDGKIDLVVANDLTPGALSVFLGVGDGTFTAGTGITLAGNYADYVLLGDFNGDGNLDLAVNNQGPNTVVVMLGNGNGTFTTSATLTGTGNPAVLAQGDFNGDGYLDIAVGGGNATAGYYTGKGDGTFNTKLSLPQSYIYNGLAAGDLNGDGVADLIAAASNNSAPLLLATASQAATASLTGVAVAGTSTHNVDASYVGDSNNAASASATTALTANALTTATTLGVLPSSPESYGTSVTISASVSPASAQGHAVTGDTVTFKNGATVLCNNVALNSSGQASCTTSALPASASNSLTAVFAGDTNFATSTSSALPFTVTQASQTITFTPSTPVTYGVPPITLAATGGGSGNAVTFSVVSGPGTISGSTLTVTGAGSIVIAANQAGNTNYTAAAQVTATIVVNTAATATTLTLRSAGSVVSTVTSGSAVTLTAAVTSGGSTMTSGTVRFCDAAATYCTDIHQLGAAQITSAGTATITLVPSVGSHSYSAVYVATASNQSSTSGSASLSVTGNLPSSTTIAVTGSVGNYTLTATVTGNGSQTTGITGSVNFQDATNANAAIGTTATLGASAPSAFFTASSNTPSSSPYKVAAVDLNGDGKLDLVEANLGNGSVSTLLGNGDGTFASPVSINNLRSVIDVVVGDFNNDGKPDAAVTLNSYQQVTVLLGNGDGTLTVQSNQPSVGTSPLGIARGDFNRDGKLDLAVANSGDSTVSILLGNGDGTFAGPSTVSVGMSPEYIGVGDFNGDGIPDLAVTNFGSNNVTILLGNGDGTFTAASVSPATGTHPVGIAVADLNGDGKLDLAVANNASNSVTVLLGNGDGTFTAASASPSTDNGPRGIAVGDFNGDGKVDLSVANYSAGTVSLLLGNGDGTFAAATTQNGGSGTYSVTVGDFNGDGTADIAAADYGSNSLTILLNEYTESATASISGVSLIGTGTHNVKASYGGDSHYAASVSDTSGLTAQLLATNIVLIANPVASSYGQTVTLTATLAPNTAQGYSTDGEAISFFNGSTLLGTANLSSGSASLQLSTLPAGSNSITAAYTTDGNFASSTATISNYSVLPASKTITFPTLTTPVTVNDTATLAATASNGDPVTYSIISGTAVLSGSNLTFTTAGSVTIAVYSVATANYTAAPAVSQTVTVNAAPSVVTMPTTPVGTTSATQTITVNIGTGGTLGSIAVLTQGASGLDFSLVSGGSCSIGTVYSLGQACTVLVTFAPLHPWVRTGGISLGSQSGSSMGKTFLTGTGTGPQVVFGSATAALTQVSSGLNQPQLGVAVDSYGNLYVSDVGNQRVVKIPFSAGTYGAPITLASGISPQGVAVDGVGAVYFADDTNNAIRKIPLIAGVYGAVSTVASGFTPVGLALDSADNVYYSDAGNQAIKKLPRTSSGYGSPVTLAANIASTLGIAVDADGNVYFANFAQNTVHQIPYNGSSYGSPAAVVSNLLGPFSVALDGAGNLYVAEINGNAVKKIAYNGSTFGMPVTLANGFSRPQGVAVDSGGSVFIADTDNNAIRKLDLADAPTLTFASTNDGSTSATQSVVVTNSGNDSLVANSFTVSSSSFSAFLNGFTPPACQLASNVAPGDSCSLNVAFAPTSPQNGVVTGTLTLTSNNLNVLANTQTVTLSGVAVGLPSVTGLSPAFGPAAGGTQVTISGGQFTGATAVSFGGAAATNVAVVSDSSILATTPAGTGTVDVVVTTASGGSATSSADQFQYQTPQTISFAPTSPVIFGIAPITLAATGGASGNPVTFTRISGPATVSGNTLTVTGAGSIVIAADQAGNTNYTAAPTVTATIVVNPATPTLTWPTPTGITYGTALSATQLNATSSVSGTFAYSPALGSVPAAGTDTLSVTFTPADTANYATASATVQLAVGKATPTVTWPTPASITYGTALSATQLNATASVAGTFVYLPALSSLPAAGTDTLSVTFTPADTANYTTASATVQLVVGKATPTLTWPTPAGINYGTALSATQLNATSSVSGTFAYSPALGSVPAAGTDTLSVTFTPADTANYTTASATVQLIVGKATPTLTWPTPAGITYGTALSTTQLNATASVAGTFVYSPALGALPAAGTDTLSVTFTPADTANYTTATATVQLAVGKATPTLTWPTPAGITYGTALSATQLDATASVAGTFAYSPALGSVPAAGTDTLSVTFTPTDTANYTTASATVQLVVGKATPTLTWPTPAGITYGTALSATQLDATASVAGTFAYSPALGALPAAGTDTLSVTFTPADTANYTTASATVQLVVGKATPTLTWPTPAGITYGTALSATQLNATSSVAGTFAYSPALGSVPAAGTDTLSVTFTPTDTANYTTASATVQLVVGKATPTLTWPTPAGITYGTALSATQLNATASVAGTFVYSPALSSLPAAGTDTLSVTFTPTDTANYTTASATVQLVVGKATPTLTWPTPAGITYGTALSATQLDATASVAGTFVYLPALGSLPAAGTDTLSVTFTPTDTGNYATASATVQLAVSKATPTLTWPTPAGITYGTALSTTQLNATASVAGTFAYSPALNSLPAAGTDTLSVTFTPTDTANYTTATATVQLAVGKATPTVTWPTPAGINYGTALSATQLNATSSVAGTFFYSPPLGSVPAAGTDTLSVIFTPTDTANYMRASTTVPLAVGKATPTLTWPTPAGIMYGTALSATQLNATASVSGTFVYSPPLGSVPAAGTDTLSMMFTPTDTANYTTATVTVPLVVQDFALNLASTNAQTQQLVYGGSATFVFAVATNNLQTFASPVTFTATGLPPGTTVAFAPATIPAGSAINTVSMTVTLPAYRAERRKPQSSRAVPLTALALLLLPFAAVRPRSRKLKRLLCMMLLAGGAMSSIMLSGCGSISSSSQRYVVTVTATSTSGTLSHSTQVILIVE